jgi:hypothetical protein
MNAILNLLRTGWRYLPRDSFPPRSNGLQHLSQVPA